MTKGANQLQQKIKAFVGGYFRNEVQKGLLLMVFVAIALLLLMVFLEYFFFLSSPLRAVLFYLLLAITLCIGVYKVLIPYFRAKGYLKSIADVNAARIIGGHFKEVGDKLLNVVQLSSASQKGAISVDLLDATIKQQTKAFTTVDFTQAVDVRERKKYLKATMFVLAIVFAISIIAPRVLKQGASRLVHYNTYYAPEAPFSFLIKNKSLSVLKSKDITIDVQLSGNILPNEVFMEEGGIKHKLEKGSNTLFKYEFKNVSENITFRLFADGFYSDKYTIMALPMPQLLAFSIKLEYPSYLKKQIEEVKNTGDLNVPAGTNVTWTVNTADSKALLFYFNNGKQPAQKLSEAEFSFSKKLFQSGNYKMQAVNGFVDSTSAVSYGITVISDLYPSIKIVQQSDSILPEMVYFKGELKDDYGFSKLVFKYRVKTASDTGKTKANFLPVRLELTEQVFSYFFDFRTISQSDDVKEIEYYFEVTDNDGLVGGKSSKSQIMVFKKPSEQEIQEQLAGENASIKQQILDAIKQAAKIQKGVDDLSKQLQEKRTPTWEDKQKTEKLLEQQQSFQNKIEQLEQKLKNNSQQNSERLQMSEDAKAMQDELAAMMKELKGNKERQKLLEQLKELMEKLDKQGINEKLENLAQKNNDAKKDLERSLEFYKQLDLERQLDDNIKKLEDAAQKQEELAEKTKDKANAKEELVKKQEELQNKFSEIEKSLKDMEQKDKALEHPNNIKTPEKDAQEVKEQMKDAQDKLSKNDRKSSSEKQKDASDKMKKIAEDLKQQQEEMMAEEEEQNMDDLRGILENLITLSFSQEDLMNKLKTTNINNPQYIEQGKQQQSIKNQAKSIEDSLFSLSKRAKEIKSIVNREVGNINQNMGQAITAIEARDVPNANMRQQFVMTGVNNLALLLNEALQQMEKQAQQKKDSKSKPGGKASCKKPGGQNEQPSESKLSRLRKMQEGLGKQMGKMPQKQGQGGSPQSGSEEIAKMALQQMMIRNELNKLNQQQMKNGEKSGGNFEDMLKKMDESAKDLANKKFNPQLMQRQQEITTRLLEAEKAEKQREQSEERISKEKEITQKRNPVDLEKYNRSVSKDFEVIKTVPLLLSDFYKNKSINYLQKVAQ